MKNASIGYNVQIVDEGLVGKPKDLMQRCFGALYPYTISFRHERKHREEDKRETVHILVD